MAWNYRVIRRRFPGHPEEPYGFDVHEVYYDADGNPESWSVEPVGPHGQSLDELRDDLQRQLEALSRPILEEHDNKLRPVED